MAEAAEQITEEPEVAEAGADDQAAKDASEALETASAPVAGLMGWKPLADWKGDPSNWKPASAFLAEFPEVLRNTRKTAERVQGKLDRVTAQVEKLSVNQRQQIDADLDAALDDAIEREDKPRQKELREAIKKNAAAGAGQSQDDDAFTAFKDRNPWFGSNDEATQVLLGLDKALNKDGAGARNPEAHFRKLDEAMKKRYPELYDGEKKPEPRAPLVNRGGRNGASPSNGEVTAATLTRQQRAAADEMNIPHDRYAKRVNEINARERA